MRQLIRKNFESDFTLTVKLSSEIGDSDFRLEFTTSGKAVYTAERKGGELSPNIADAGDGMYLVTFRKHGLEPGLLRMKSIVFVKNDNSPDGEMAEVSANQCLGIELWKGMSDEVALPEVSLLPQIVFPDMTPIPLTFKLSSGECVDFNLIGTFTVRESEGYGYEYGYYGEAEGLGVFDELADYATEINETA